MTERDEFNSRTTDLATAIVTMQNRAKPLAWYCNCCGRSDLNLGETETGLTLCDFCGYHVNFSGQCLVHGGPVVYPERLGRTAPPLSNDELADLYPPPPTPPRRTFTPDEMQAMALHDFEHD